MSHFSVLVIDTEGFTDVEDVLAPYEECLEVEFEDFSYEVKESWEELPVFDKEIYNNSLGDFASDYYGYQEQNGKYGYWTNPDAKWDWYEIGGRWENMIPLETGEMVDQAYLRDIDLNAFRRNEKQHKDALRFWELYVEGQAPVTKEDKSLINFVLYSKEWFVERYHTKEEYAKQISEFSTYAVIIDGNWCSRGEMGWFGCGSETFEESYEWDKSYFEKFIANLSPDAYITVVDCHI